MRWINFITCLHSATKRVDFSRWSWCVGKSALFLLFFCVSLYIFLFLTLSLSHSFSLFLSLSFISALALIKKHFIMHGNCTVKHWWPPSYCVSVLRKKSRYLLIRSETTWYHRKECEIFPSVRCGLLEHCKLCWCQDTWKTVRKHRTQVCVRVQIVCHSICSTKILPNSCNECWLMSKAKWII